MIVFENVSTLIISEIKQSILIDINQIPIIR